MSARETTLQRSSSSHQVRQFPGTGITMHLLGISKSFFFLQNYRNDHNVHV
jgi:hypothetical protein